MRECFLSFLPLDLCSPTVMATDGLPASNARALSLAVFGKRLRGCGSVHVYSVIEIYIPKG